MSRLLQTIRLVRPVMPLRIAAARPPTLFRGYPGRSEMNEDDAKTREKEKDANLTGQDKPSHTIDNAPGWNEALASESEANIKAEREELGDITVEVLQKKTVKHVHEKHHK